ncbi:MAG TPA: gluconate 2-dehydrogenase subunit 3 family protein [Woeseiaceae bacterium]|jgi:hypothetical protein|nr:gluconate 2-dehydrogenase subunit 3 family protein [Woeseiaceae bacterium]
MTNKQDKLLTRREAIARVSAMFGGAALVGQSALLTACSHPDPEVEAQVRAGEGLFSADEVALLDEIADTILPDTDTPGAKAAGVGPFMALVVSDIYRDDQQAIFRAGLAEVDTRAGEAFGAGFMALSSGQRLELLTALDVEQYEYMQQHEDGPVHFFRMMKQVALFGYFTSEIGATQAMRYVETPGRYDPCAPYKPGDKAWARHV